ncbi:MAG TPA: M14 family metallopeptidase [Symbiobacteriaceae bacterium]|nr:M14 family metallopeptidase [Symbiobacteriaceae bacterium]
MIAYEPGRYLRYDEMTAFLQACAAEYPELCTLAEVGRSAGGRSVWAVTLTNAGTGLHDRKPGYLVDANTHAGEVTGGAAALYTIWWLLTKYGLDSAATELLDTRAVYAIPRIAVDGVEMYLTTPHLLRSSPRRYPEPDEPPGLYPADANGDGKILTMRATHPDGDWKVSAADPRAMVRRRPEDRVGPFYRLYTEGFIKGWDGLAVPPPRAPWRLDFNRNYPAFWNPEAKQPGAGPYPLSEPETRAVADFIVRHPNIGAYVAFHTTGSVLLRPPSYGPDDKMSAPDLEVFKRIGELCTRLTGSPCKSTFQAFHFPGQEALVKGADDWAYEHYGIQAFTFELWNPDLRSGGEGYAQIGLAGLLARSAEQEDEAERKRLAWNDRELGGRGFVDWAPFDHPQLGPVEIGGWDWKQSLQNPPEGPLLVEEVRKASAFIVAHALATPRLAVALTAEPLGAGLYKLTAAVQNVGGLPTNVTDMAVSMKTARPISVKLAGDVAVLSGKSAQELGHLEGWVAAGGRPARSEIWVDWVVRSTHAVVTVSTPRAGTASAQWNAPSER